MLASLGGVDGATVADLWAGSGSFGIECLSRGAERAIFVERGREALACLRENLVDLGFDDQAEVIGGSVLSTLNRLGPVDLAFCDPPYADDPWAELWPRLDSGLVVGHAEQPVEVGPGWEELRRRSYGRAHVLIAGRAVEGPAKKAAELCKEIPGSSVESV